MNLEEIENRVRDSLVALNSPDELYDWRLTFFNGPAWDDLSEACYELSESKIGEDKLKEHIKLFRDKSEISFIDHHIKVPEPSKKDFERMALLFGPLRNDQRLLPPRNAETRKVYVAQKILAAMRLSMENKQVISDKIKQQYNWLMIRTQNTERTPEMMAVHLQLSDYNAYHKRLEPGATVIMTHHLIQQEQLTDAEALEIVEPMFGSSSFGTDNSSFESRLADVPIKGKRTARERAGEYKTHHVPVALGVELAREMLNPAKQEAAHELPSEIHEEFAAYCQDLYEKAKGH